MLVYRVIKNMNDEYMPITEKMSAVKAMKLINIPNSSYFWYFEDARVEADRLNNKQVVWDLENYKFEEE